MRLFTAFQLLTAAVALPVAAVRMRYTTLNHTGGGCPDQKRMAVNGNAAFTSLFQSLPNFSIDIENWSGERYTSLCTAYVNVTFTEPGYLLDVNTDVGKMNGWLYKSSDSWDAHLKITYEWDDQMGQSSIDEDLNGPFRGKFENRPIGVPNNTASVQSACGGGILKAVYYLKMNVPQPAEPDIGIGLPLGSPWYIQTPIEVFSC